MILLMEVMLVKHSPPAAVPGLIASGEGTGSDDAGDIVADANDRRDGERGTVGVLTGVSLGESPPPALPRRSRDCGRITGEPAKKYVNMREKKDHLMTQYRSQCTGTISLHQLLEGRNIMM